MYCWTNSKKKVCNWNRIILSKDLVNFICHNKQKVIINRCDDEDYHNFFIDT